jgi:hypothetical protein
MPQDGHGRSIHRTHKVSELPAKFACSRAWTATQQFARGEGCVPPSRTNKTGRERHVSAPLPTPLPSAPSPLVTENVLPRLAVELALQFFDLVLEARIVAYLLVYLAYRVKHGGVVPIAEPASDLRQRPGGELFC